MRRRYPLLVRLARVDHELASAAQFLDLLARDMIETQRRGARAGDRTTLLAAMTGALLLVAGSDSGLVAAWLVEITTEGDLADADALGTEIVDELLLRHGGVAGEG